jgi:hypothetical protein
MDEKKGSAGDRLLDDEMIATPKTCSGKGSS